MRVIIAGTRDFNDYPLLEAKLDYYLSNSKTESIVIVSGGASGADALGERYAKTRGFPLERYPADWQQYGRRAGPLRNERMAAVSDACILFWDGKSKGTKSMLHAARKKDIPVRVVRYD